MLKSPSGGSKSSRSNSMDSEDRISQQTTCSIQSPSTASSRPETPGAENSALVVKNDSTIPNSPPPSYEHVLEERRLVQTAAEEPEEDSDSYEVNEPEACPQGQEHTRALGGTGKDGERTLAKGPEIVHKSSKEFYRAVAKQWGITCKMSDHCRCLDCQSRYFDCDYDNNDQEKTDGGLGAGTPMFINEVMHGAACVLL